VEVCDATGRAAVSESAASGFGGFPSGPVEFGAWVAPHLDILRAIAIREVGLGDADDLVQDALIRAWRRRSTFRDHRGTPRAWLVAVLLDQARRRRIRLRPAVAAIEPEAAAAPGPDRLDVELAVRRLPRRQREVITLYYLADFSVAEIAGVLSISAGSVKSHLHDARANLRTALERE
jgi:RNA polymerase sigma-70 factor (ECF subfamily)